ncbi:MAG: hypothetical protein RDV41_02600 [Planctomycetota bacterium]|nr:hypothetical protein [Planctomycetota bacterium]
MHVHKSHLIQEGNVLAVRFGGSRATKVVALISALIGIAVCYAAYVGSGDLARDPWVGWLIGGLFVLFGICGASFRSETQFDPAGRRWHVWWTLLTLGSRRHGSFDDLLEVEVTREERSADSGTYSVYPVKVKVSDGHDITVLESASAGDALETATKLSKGIGIPLSDRSVEQTMMTVPAPEGVPVPAVRICTYSVTRDTVSIVVPPGTKPEAIGCSALLLGLAGAVALAVWHFFLSTAEGVFPWIVAAIFAGGPFVVLPLVGMFYILVKTFLMEERLEFTPDGLTRHVAFGPWRWAKKYAREDISRVDLRVGTKDGRICEIVITTSEGQLTVGRGLPQAEKAWLAVIIRNILHLA